MIAKSSLAMLLVGLSLAAGGGCHHYCCDGGLDSYSPVQKGVAQKGSCGKGCDGTCRCGLFSGFHGCSHGCGEVYWGEWLNDPPDCCDPCCDCYGVWTGPRDDCRRVIIDPLLWLLAIEHRHCRPPWHGAPCPYGYNFHEQYYGPYPAEAYNPYGDYRCDSPGGGCGCAQQSDAQRR